MHSADFDKKSNKSNFFVWLKAFLIVGLILFFYRILQNAGFAGRLNFSSSNLTLGISFLTGVAASVSSCLAVVGAVVMAFAEKYETSEDKNFFSAAVKPNLLFHLGRLATFFVLGGALGLVGGKINIGGNFVGVYTIIVAIVMGWLGLNILGLVPSVSALGIGPPKSIRELWYRLEESNHQAAPLLLGGLTFFLPCGFTQSMQILALASGSAWGGAMSLFVFALGTLPVLLALGISASWGKMKKAAVLEKAVGILILVFSIFTLNSGWALTGGGNKIAGSPEKKDIASRRDIPEEQIVKMAITSRGFEPNILEVRKDVPVKWIVNGDEATGCTNKIVIPSYNIAKNISPGENIIKFVPRDAGNISYSCWMGMVRGKFVVQ